jgi:hypothetical protein
VHEAFLRLVDADVTWKDRGHFFGIASRLMRQILVDHARAWRAQKRGHGWCRLSLHEDRLSAVLSIATSAANSPHNVALSGSGR